MIKKTCIAYLVLTINVIFHKFDQLLDIFLTKRRPEIMLYFEDMILNQGPREGGVRGILLLVEENVICLEFFTSRSYHILKF